MIVLGIIVLIVVPPEKLPEVMRGIGRFMNDVKRQTSGVWDDIKKDAAFRPEDVIKPSDFTMKKLLEDEVRKPASSAPSAPAQAQANTDDDKSKQS